MEKIKSYFDRKYSEYKEYANHFLSITDGIKEKNEELAKTVIENVDEFTNKFIEVKLIPQLHIKEITELEKVLVELYKMLSTEVDFPQDVKDEMTKMAEIKHVFCVKNGNLAVLDQDHFDKIKAEAKQQYEKIHKEFIAYG